MRPPKRLRAIVTAAEAVGWVYDTTSKGHPRLSPPRGWRAPIEGVEIRPIIFAATPSDARGDKNSVQRLRRQGVEVPDI